MGVLAVGAIGLGVAADPGRHRGRPPLPRADLPGLRALRGARAVDRRPRGSGWSSARVIGLAGIALAYRLWVQDREAPARIRARLAGLHRFFAQQVVLRRADRHRRSSGRSRGSGASRATRSSGSSSTACSSAGPAGVVRAGSRRRARGPVRLPARLRGAAAARPHRPRPLLPDRRVVTIHLSIVLFAPLAFALAGRARPAARWPRRSALLGSLDHARATRSLMLFDFDHAQAGPAVRHGRRSGSRRSASATRSASTA